MDFPNATSKSKAHQLWVQVLSHIGKFDQTTTEHSQDNKNCIKHDNPLPFEKEAHHYIEIE